MNHKQYSEIQHCLGVLEGVGYALEGQASLLFYDTLEALSSIIDKLRPEIGNEEGCTEEECSPKDMPPLGTVTHEEAVAMFRGIMDRAKANREREEEGVTVDAGNGTAISNCSTHYDPDIPSTPTRPLG